MISEGINEQYEEQDLLHRLKNGQIAAFDQVYHLYFRRLCYFAFSMIDDLPTAEDLAVDSFIKLLQKPNEFTTLAMLRGYLFRIVRNACLDHIKAEKRHRQSHEEINYLGGVQEDAELALIRSETLESIYQEIHRLPPQCQRIISLVFISGKSVKEIAEDLNLAVQTIQNQKNRGIKLIKKALIRNRLLSPSAVWLILEWFHKG